MLELNLQGHLALITGATGQLGRVMARTLAGCGADVVVHYHQNAEKAQELCQEISGMGRRTLAVTGNVSNKADVFAMRDQIVAQLGHPSIIVTNAVSQIHPWLTVLEEEEEDYEDQFRTCVMQNVLFAKAFVPAMIERGQGRFIGINTECSMQLFKNYSAYGSAKRAMDGVLRVLAKEIGSHQITVNQVAPGWTISDRDRERGSEKNERYDSTVPLARRGTDQEIANVVAFLASDLASYITGAYIPVCGGNVMPTIQDFRLRICGACDGWLEVGYPGIRAFSLIKRMEFYMEANAALPSTSRSNTIWLLTAGGFYSFLLFGFIDNLKGPTLPNLLREMQFDYSQGGGILMGAYLGFMIATFLSGPLADRVGTRTILLAAGLLIGVGAFAFGASNSYGLLFVAMLTIGLGTGAIEVGGNALIVAIHPQNQGRLLNLLATFHGVGSLVAPLIAARLLTLEWSWRQLFQWSMPVALLLALIFLVSPTPQRDIQSGNNDFNWQIIRRNGFGLKMICFYFAIALYVATELGIAAWIVEYLIQAKSYSQATASLYLSAFFGMIMIGRIIGSLMVDRIGYLRSVLLAMGGALLCLMIAILSPPTLAFFLPLSGFFCSIIFPTITAAVSRLHTQNRGTILGLLFTAGGLGGTLGPWLIGVTSDLYGIQQGFGLNILYCAGAIGALVILMISE